VINKRRMSIDNGKDWIRQWLDCCNSIKSTDYISDDYIIYYLNAAKTSGYDPLSINSVREYDWRVSGISDNNNTLLYNVIKNQK
jgi:hypothetical protein